MIYPLLKAIKSDYSIGVVTYVRRFEKFLKPLVASLEKYFPDVEKNYVLNGFYDQTVQQEYLKNAKEFLRGTTAKNVIAYDQSQSLSKCFNQLLLHSSANKTLILNDDILVRFLFRPFFEAQMWPFENGVVNNTWSHSWFSKDTIRKVGWFDERFPAIGQEDGDYGLRLAKAYGLTNISTLHRHNIYCFGITNIIAGNTDPGWKKDSPIVNNSYAQTNDDYYKKKWEISKQPLENSVCHNGTYYRIRPGFETPQFYDFSLLDNPLKSPL
jgi:hypothetical protein